MRDLRFALPAVLLAVFPVLFFYRHNFSEITDRQVIAIPLTLSIAVPLLVYFGLLGWIADRVRRAVYGSAIVIFLFLFGPVADLLEPAGWASLTWISALVWTILWGASLILISRRRTSLVALFNGVFYCSSFVVFCELFLIGTEFVSSPEIRIEAIQSVKPQPERKFPDIYHIVLDGYAGAPLLKEKFHDDNGEFLEPLKGRGFTVVSRSRSNYPVTIVSLASMLNLEYASALPIQVPTNKKDPKVFIQLIHANAVSRFLREIGYEVVHFKTDWPGTSHNLYATQVVDCFEGARLGNGSRFFLAWQHSTILRVFNRSFYRARVADPSADAFECMFTKLEESRRIAGPKYVFAHILLPHPPYVFEENGNRREYSMSGLRDWRPEVEYWAQLKYLNKRVSGIVDAILAEQGYDPIIILHSDHGPAFSGNAYSAEIFDEMLQERFSNLMAIRLPPGDERPRLRWDNPGKRL